MLWLLPILNTVAVAVTIGVTIYGFVVKYNAMRSRKLMPELAYPEGNLPVLGHVLEFIVHCTSGATLWKFVVNNCDYYKNGFHGSLGHQQWVFMPDHDVMKEVLSNNEVVEKNFIYDFLKCVSDGVFIAPGYKWRMLRKRLNLTFSAKQLESYMEAVNHHSEIYLNKVIKKISQESKFVDIQPHIARYFFDIMTKTHFGVETYEQVENKYDVSEAASKIIEYILEWRVLMPHLHEDFFFQMSKTFQEICRIRAKPLQFINSMIERRKQDVEQQKDTSNGAIVYIDLVNDALKEMNIPPTVENIQKNSNDVLIAGSDTASVSAGALLYFLAAHKDMQEKVYEEVSVIYGQDNFRPLTRQDLNSMTYLDMAVNEAIRWTAPVGILKTFRHDLDAVKLTIPKNVNLYVLLGIQHRNPDYYDKPNEFYPEHFTPEAVKSRPKMAFIPFSSGPRNCPGKLFAYILIKAATAVVINNYHLDTNLPLDEVKYKILLMTQHVQGYPVSFTPRQHLSPRS